MAGDRDNRRSTTGYVFTVGGTTLNWVLKMENVVALSTMEAKYVAAIETSKEMIGYKYLWMNWARIRSWEGYTVTSRVPFIFQIIQHFIPRLNVYISRTISYGQCWNVDS